jgi:hypothetical protein
MRSIYDVVNVINSKDMDRIRAYFTPLNVNDFVGNIEYHKYRALELACSDLTFDCVVVVKYMLDCGAVIDTDNITYHCAAMNGYVECLRVLLARGFPTSYLLHGRTPLDSAIVYQKRTCARLLLDHGVHSNKCMPAWITPFEWGRLQARHTGVILMCALKRAGMNRDLVPLIGQWVWASRGCEGWK